MLNNAIKDRILELRQKGYGYKSISSILKVKRDDVRDFCRSKGLSGYLGYGKSVSSYPEIKVKDYQEKCQQCGREINMNDKLGRKSKFCSNKCRRTWWSNHPENKDKREKAWYSFICLYCGKEFKAYGNKNRKYCSRRCSQNHRYGHFKEKTGYEERMEKEFKNNF